MLSAAAALAIAWPCATARADGAVIVAGKVTQRDRELIVDTVRGEGTALSLKFSASTFSRDAADASIACLKDKMPWSCVSPTLRGKDQLVIVEVSSDRGVGAPMTVVTAHLLTAGAEDDSFASRNCAMCNEDALKRTVGDLSRDLLQRAVARTGRTKLTISSRPDGALVILDGSTVGTVGQTIATYPGKHTITLRLPGYVSATRSLVIADGTSTDVSVELVPAARGGDEHASQFLPGLAIGLGAAAIAAGGILLAINEIPDRHGPQQATYYNTATYGYVSIGAGVVCAGAGIYFLLHARATSTAVVAPIPGGAAVGWIGRF